MTIINKLSSILDGLVASEAKWVKINQIAATAGNEFEYRRLVAKLSTPTAPRPVSRPKLVGKPGPGNTGIMNGMPINSPDLNAPARRLLAELAGASLRQWQTQWRTVGAQ